MARSSALQLLACLLGSASLSFTIVGCSQDPLGRQAVSGSVKIDGAPLAQGDINFEPIEGQPTAGGAVVTAGNYRVERAGGLVPGKYRVSIHAPVPGTGGQTDENSMPGEPPAPPKELIPRQWNTESNETIQVTKQGKNAFDFDISIKSSPAQAAAAKSKP